MDSYSATIAAYPVGVQLGAGLVLLLGTGVWVPSVVKTYGQRYFDWPPEKAVPPWERLLAVAVTMALLAALAVSRPPATLPFFALLLTALTGVFLADRRFQVIPDRFQAAGLVASAGLAAVATADSAGQVLLRCAAGLLLPGALLLLERLYVWVRRRPALGFGDIKLLGWLAIAFGLTTFRVAGLSLAIALVAILPSLVTRSRSLTTTFAFGPYVVLAAALQLLVATPPFSALGLG